jgi:hypothetical protein
VHNAPCGEHETGTETSHWFEMTDHDIGTVAIAVRWPPRHYNGGNL